MKISRFVWLAVSLGFLAPAQAETDIEDLSGSWSVNGLDHPFNEVLELEFLPGEIVKSVSFNLAGLTNPANVGTLGGSWASDARIRVYSSDGKVDFTWQPWAGVNSPGTNTSATMTSNGGSGLPWTVPHEGGDLFVEFYESYDDDSEEVDGFYASGSTMTVIYDAHPDSDHDGLPDVWEELQNLKIGVNDSMADPDLDGVPNLLEYAFVSDPHEFSSGIMPTMLVEDNHLTLTYIRHRDELDILYIPELSHNLSSWQSGAAVIEEYRVTARDDVSDWVTVREKAEIQRGGRSYLRLKVQHVP